MAAAQAVGLLLHHRRRFAPAQAGLVAVPELVADLVIDGVRPVVRQLRGVAPRPLRPQIRVDDDLTPSTLKPKNR